MDPTLKGGRVPVPTAQKPTGLFTKQTFIVIVAVVVAIIAGGLLLLSSGDKSIKLLPKLSVRQETTLKLIADGQKNITDQDLKKINSELNSNLMSDNAAIQAAIKGAGVTSKKITKDIKAKEADAALFEKLANAKLNGQYNATYQTVAVTKLRSLQSLLKETHDKSKNKEFRTILALEYEHLGIHIKALEAL